MFDGMPLRHMQTGNTHPVSSLRGVPHDILNAHGVEQAAGPSKHCWPWQGRLLPGTQVSHDLLHSPDHTVSRLPEYVQQIIYSQLQPGLVRVLRHETSNMQL